MTTNPPVRRLADWPDGRLRELADEHGTPLYVIDPDRIRENADRLGTAFPEAEVSYALKANTNRAVLDTVEQCGLGAECASAGEVQRAIDAGFSGDRIRYTAVNPPARDLDHVVELARGHEFVTTIGALDTLDRLRDRDFAGHICVRVNPGVGAGHHAKVTTGDAPQFGIPYDRVPDVCTSIRTEMPAVDLVGLHAHAGSGISGDDLSAHRELVRRMAELGRQVGGLDFVAVGGGFGVPYDPEEPPLDLDAVAAATREAFDRCNAQLAIEPGRYLVADSGVLLTTVTAVKPTPETPVVGVDAGMTTLLRPALYGAVHEIHSLAPDGDARPSRSCLLAGPICETADVLDRNRSLPDPRYGDVLAVGNAGAYGYEMASQYNSRPRPAVVSLAGDRIARRETISDLTRLER
ncbi:diaminopimelate decarboxylase [Halocatena salina]|uniref:Diaminopimelate decarboxylase n=1 Tax=Halocatena salina TaxID=2934340 RepID=A0A8U0A4D1_9EURY|nr:diaminopimelate decarboxylase [Halocatena salina]UPM43669.1 diaminopimelate decarboxylase [Halocatena salina]